MATAGNPFVGNGWSTSAPNPQSPAGSQLFNAPPPNSSLLGWPGQNVNQNFGATSASAPTVTGPPQGAWGNPGNLPNPGTNQKDQIRNAGFLGVEQGQLRNQLIPIFANLMTNYGGSAGDFFKTLMNLGSPYYQQKQAEGFNQGVQQNQNAAAQTQQELASRGYGNTPSGINAATLGAMNMQGSQNLAQNFLQQLFQNEQLQLGGAQGLSSLAGLFNPSSLFGQTGPQGTTQGPSATSAFKDVLGGINSLFGGGQGGQGAGAATAFFG